MSPHERINPVGLVPATGFSHAVVPAGGRLVCLAGQTAHRADATLPAGGLVEQFAAAAANLALAMDAAGATPADLVWLQVFTTDVAGYRAALGPLGAAWREVFGRDYPAMGLFGVTGLFDPDTVVELMGLAVVPE